jgi:cyclic pyranopterin phosphate synthase
VPLVDSFGRVHRDLRISVTDRCNLRCGYCMPAEGMKWLPRSEVLTFEEITRIARLLVERFGISSIRLTGGEPTMRAHLPVLVAQLAALGVDLSLTTNAVTLASQAHDLAAAGLGRVNISCDSLQRERFAELTGRDELHHVLEGIDAALAAGLSPVKLNVVLMRGRNDSEIIDLVSFGRDRGVEVRFIEFMPLDADGAWQRDQVVSAAEIVSTIEAVYPLEALSRDHAPARRWAYRDGRGAVGIVASVTQSFCESCDRVRLTADGKLRNCLFAQGETDLRDLLRAGADDDALAAAVVGCIAEKRAGHGIGSVTFVRPPRSMSQIGG